METTLKLAQADVEFILQTLTQQPLPYVRTAPLIQAIVSQANEQVAAAQSPPAD